MTRKRVALLTPLLLVLAVLAADPIVEEVVEWRVAAAVDACTDMGGVELDLGRWPLLVRAMSGRLSDVRGRIERIDVRGLRLRHVSLRVGQVGLSPGVLFGRDVTVHDAAVTVSVGEADLGRFARGHGVPVEVDLGPQRIVFRPSPSLLGGLALPAVVRLEAGAVVASLAVPEENLIGRLLPQDFTLRPPAGARFTRLEIDDSGVEAAVTFSGRAAVGDFCA